MSIATQTPPVEATILSIIRRNMPFLLGRLRSLRTHIEDETGGLTDEQACLLTDVCTSLGMLDSEVLYVVGDEARRDDDHVRMPVVGTLSEHTTPDEFAEFRKRAGIG